MMWVVVAAVVFDLDGVLVDSEPVWEEVRRRYVADHGGQWRPDTQRRPMGLASSSPPRLIRAALDATGLAATFAVTLSTEEVPHGKPAPDVYLAVAERLGVDPAGCVAVEDSSNGVRSAAAAGMRVVAVPHPRYPLDEDARMRAAVVVADIRAVTTDAVRAASTGASGHT